MNTLLLIVLWVCEITFMALAIAKKPEKKLWNQSRVMVAAGETVLFLLLLLLPGIDLGFRFAMLFGLLVFRLIWSGLLALLLRKKANEKKKIPAILFHTVGSMILFAFSLFPSYLILDYKGLPVSGAYNVGMAQGILVDPDRTETFETDGSCREVPVYFYYPENAASGEKYPVVFFSHGAFGYYQSNSSTYMELASEGYVVVSVEHPYHSLFTKDTDGRTIIADVTFLNDVLRATDETDITEQEIVELSSKWVELRTADLNFAIDTLKADALSGELSAQWHTEKPEEIGTILAMCDFEHLGLMGHSLGGASSVELGRVRTDVDAVVNFDGTMLGEILGVAEDGVHDIIREEEYSVPILSFDNEVHHADRMSCMENGEPYANNVLLDNATEGYATYIVGTEHMNYTDLPLIAPIPAKMLGTGSADPKACVEKMNEVTLSFFDHYLKDKGEFSVDECIELSES